MDLASAALIFAENLMTKTWPKRWGTYDHQTMSEVVTGIVKVTSDPQMVETLVRIARYETGGWRRDVVTCKNAKGYAFGAFGVCPFNKQERLDVCSSTFSVQASLAMKRVKISMDACYSAGLKGSNLVTAYTHGKCQAANDLISRTHWGDGKELSELLKTPVAHDDGYDDL